MTIRRKILAALLAALMLALVSCRSEKKKETDDDDALSHQFHYRLTEAFDFSTKDMNGKEVSFKDYSSAKVIMFNMWEPWCGPCCAELPELQKLYEKYSQQGLMILGVYSDTDGLADVVKENKIGYPMIRSCAAFDPFQTGYVPTTFFTDGNGNILSEEPYIGSKSYEEWESVILSYLK